MSFFKKTILLFFSCLTANAIAQSDTTSTIKFYINADAIVFNKESYTDFSQGLTAITNQITPTINFGLGKKTQLSLGYHFNYIAGRNKFFKTLPVISIRQEIAKDINLTMGAINGNGNRNLSWLLIAPETLVFNPFGYGLELTIAKNNVESSTWINWETFIEKGDNLQEEFTAGWNNKYLYTINKTNSIKFNLDLIFKHIGGQIDSSSNPATTRVNGCFGVSYKRNLSAQWLYSFGLNSYLYKGLSVPSQGVHSLPYKEGYALQPTLLLKYNIHSLKLSYIYMNKYINDLGDNDFTVKSDYSSYFIDRRNLFTGMYDINKKWKNGVTLTLSNGFNFDLNRKKYTITSLLALNVNISNNNKVSF